MEDVSVISFRLHHMGKAQLISPHLVFPIPSDPAQERGFPSEKFD